MRRETPLTGREKIFEVRRTEDDLSFLRNYLARSRAAPQPVCLRQQLHSPAWEAVSAVSNGGDHGSGTRCRGGSPAGTPLNYGVPRIVIQEVVNNTLCLEHLDRATTFLDRQYANNTLMYVAELWKHPVNLLTNEDGRDTTLTARPNI